MRRYPFDTWPKAFPGVSYEIADVMISRGGRYKRFGKYFVKERDAHVKRHKNINAYDRDQNLLCTLKKQAYSFDFKLEERYYLRYLNNIYFRERCSYPIQHNFDTYYYFDLFEEDSMLMRDSVASLYNQHFDDEHRNTTINKYNPNDFNFRELIRQGKSPCEHTDFYELAYAYGGPQGHSILHKVDIRVLLTRDYNSILKQQHKLNYYEYNIGQLKKYFGKYNIERLSMKDKINISMKRLQYPERFNKYV